MNKEVSPINNSKTISVGSLAELYDLLLMRAMACPSQLVTREQAEGYYSHTIESQPPIHLRLPELVTISSEPNAWPEQKQHQE